VSGISVSGFGIAGSVIGNGTHGAPTGVSVPVSVSISGLSLYYPAYYKQLPAVSGTPIFNTNFPQTAGAATGSTITYPLPIATTDYDWIAVQASIPLSKLFLITPLGNTPLIPDARPGNQTIGGVGYTVYGFTSLNTNVAAQLYISP
jgi:hypothetical protein